MTLRAVIRTPRLTLRPLNPADETEVVAGIGDYEVSRWLYSAPHPYRAADYVRFLATVRPGEVWAVDDGTGACGTIGLDSTFGYWLARRVWGRGYATEAGRALLAVHFADPSAGPVGSGRFEGNLRSAHVLMKLGFRPDGFETVACLASGDTDIRLHRTILTRADWLTASPLVITTPRLSLKPLEAARDIAALARIGGDRRVARMASAIPSPWSATEIEQWLDRLPWRGTLGFRLGIFLRGNGPLVGFLGLTEDDPPAAMYALDPAYWGQGLASEAMRALLDWALPLFRPQAIIADHFADNPASGRVLEKLGFSETGTATGRSRARKGAAPLRCWRLAV
jgi:RimJ/RimL family protein N-acetyltransferase